MVMYRIGFSDLRVYESFGKKWKKSLRKFPEAVGVAELFKANGTLNLIRDKKENKFLIGGLASGKIFGGRIGILPSGEKLDKAFPLFAQDLKIHDEKSSSHWDVIFRNPNGDFSYVYTLSKNSLARKNKFDKVDRFERCLPKIKRGIEKDLKKGDILAIALATLLKTCLRVGNEIYYRLDGHKGLTTIQKRDIIIKGNFVTFSLLAKDGVPLKIREKFSEEYIKQLKKVLQIRNDKSFVFSNSRGHPLKDVVFERAFENYCGVRFYPHIVRSHFATKKAKEFLKNRKKTSEGDVKKLYNSIAEKLGHKKFSKKEGEWKDSYQVTLHHYIDPKIVEKIEKITYKD